MSAQHTPGPWQVIKRDDQSHDIGTLADAPRAAGVAVARAVHNEANARLIAAAPELIEALREFGAAFTLMALREGQEDRMRAAWDRGLAAIAKAEGRE